MRNEEYLRILMMEDMTREFFLKQIVNELCENHNLYGFVEKFKDLVYLVCIEDYFILLDDKKLKGLITVIDPFKLDRYLIEEFKDEGLDIRKIDLIEL